IAVVTGDEAIFGCISDKPFVLLVIVEQAGTTGSEEDPSLFVFDYLRYGKCSQSVFTRTVLYLVFFIFEVDLPDTFAVGQPNVPFRVNEEAGVPVILTAF